MTKNLKRKHISETTMNGQKYIVIVLEKGKTGKRTIVCRHSVRKTYATFQIIYNRLDLHTLAKNMGTSIAMLERHYSHLEVLHRAEALAGKAEQGKPRGKSRVRETRIIELGGESEAISKGPSDDLAELIDKRRRQESSIKVD